MPKIDSKAEMSQFSDTDLCVLVCDGSDIAFEEITRRYQGLIRAIAKDFSYPGFDSNDFFQLGLMGLLSACKAFHDDGKISFKNFAALCIKRRFISLVRSLETKGSAFHSSLSDTDESIADLNTYNPETLMLQKEADKSFITSFKSRLSCMEYEVLKGYVGGKTYKEIAEVTGLSPKAVDNALQRIRKKLLN